MKRFAISKHASLKTLLATLVMGLSAFAHADLSHWTEAEVKKINDKKGTITLYHGPLEHLDLLEPITNDYHPKDPALLQQLKVGDFIRVNIELIDGRYLIVETTPSKP